jgi:hypothetical protein
VLHKKDYWRLRIYVEVYKTRFHEIIWFPYRPELKLIGPLLVLIFIAVAATGVIRTVDIFSSFTAKDTGGLGPWIVILIIAACLAVCVYSARLDYFSVFAALLPCFVTTLVIVALSLYLTSRQIDTKSLLQASAGALASILFTGRLVQSGGIDLGKIGTVYRRTKRKAKLSLQTSVAENIFTTRRAELTKDVEELADELETAAPETVDRTSSEKAVALLKAFLERSKLVDHADFLHDINEGKGSLMETLELVGKRSDRGE